MADSTDYAAARNNMVDSQVRPNKVTDPRVLDAMRRLPRERFVPPSQAAQAYIDGAVPLGGGRFLIEPMVIARLVQLARGRPGERALVIGAGSGYGAALLAACDCAVTALEDDPALIALARAVLPEAAPAVRVQLGPLANGLPHDGPWDVILIEGGVSALPETLAGQLAPGGRLVAVIVERGEIGRAVLGERSGTPDAARIQHRAIFGLPRWDASELAACACFRVLRTKTLVCQRVLWQVYVG